MVWRKQVREPALEIVELEGAVILTEAEEPTGNGADDRQ
jgi:hypothetical protein